MSAPRVMPYSCDPRSSQVEMVANESVGAPAGKYDDTAFTIVESSNQHTMR